MARDYKLKPFQASEHDEQCAVVEALEMLGARFFAIPNFRNLKGQYALWSHLVAEGVRKGVPDIFVCEPRVYQDNPCAGLFIEMKRRDGGTVSDEQDEWIADLEARGYAVVVAAGASQAIAAATAYLRGENPFKDAMPGGRRAAVRAF